jgi:hypothetical protein
LFEWKIYFDLREKIMNKRIIMSIAASKIACGFSLAHAEQPELTLDEAVFDSNILSLPNGATPGTLYVDSAAKKRIDFIVRGIQKTGTVHVFLAYSKNAGYADQWPVFTTGQGQLELEPDSLKVLAAVNVQNQVLEGIAGDNPLGTLNRDENTMILPIDLSDLTDIGTDGASIYFQVVAVQIDETGYLWHTAQASEVDKFIIDKSTDNNEGGSNNGGK